MTRNLNTIMMDLGTGALLLTGITQSTGNAIAFAQDYVKGKEELLGKLGTSIVQYGIPVAALCGTGYIAFKALNAADDYWVRNQKR